MRKLEKHCL